jgi:hypothetical protein
MSLLRDRDGAVTAVRHHINVVRLDYEPRVGVLFLFSHNLRERLGRRGRLSGRALLWMDSPEYKWRCSPR